MRLIITCISLLAVLLTGKVVATDGTLTIEIGKSKDVTPIQYGFHYEEIGMIGEGGLHAELVRNRALEESNMPRGLEVKGNRYVGIRGKPEGNKEVYRKDPITGWELAPGSVGIKLSRVSSNPLNDMNPHSLWVEVEETAGFFAFHNTGFFGMNFEQGETYELSLYVRQNEYNGSLGIQLSDSSGMPISDIFSLKNLPHDWTRYSFTFTALRSTTDGVLRFIPNGVGNFQLDVVSLFPGNTWDAGKSIFRRDIMQNLRDYNPDFVRFPGGCIVHGCSVGTIYYWKETIGPIEERPGAWSKWAPHYRTDGFGYHEFLELCEYLEADAMFVVPTGMICTGWVPRDEEGNHIHPEVDVDAFIQNALDAIEYAIGPADSKWGSIRAENGHPAPFPLKYIELGNEDFGQTYWDRHDKFFTAIGERYPQIRIITNSRIFKDFDDKRSELPSFKNPELIEIFDEHYYKDMDWVFNSFNKFDKYDRPSPDLFIGELGINGPYPASLLGEGIINMYLERNADLNPLVADRPLMRNWNFEDPKGPRPVMLYHTSSQSFKTFNFHVSKLFRDNKIDRYIHSEWQPTRGKRMIGSRHLFSSAGIDSKTNCFILKLINLQDKSVTFDIRTGKGSFSTKAEVTVLSAEPNQFSTPRNPQAIVPHNRQQDLSNERSYELSPRSLTIIRIPLTEEFPIDYQ